MHSWNSMLPQLCTYNLPNIMWELPVQKDYVCLFTPVSHTGCPMWQGWPLTICGVETLQGEDVSVSCSGHIGSPSLIHLEVRHLLCHVSMAVLQVNSIIYRHQHLCSNSKLRWHSSPQSILSFYARHLLWSNGADWRQQYFLRSVLYPGRRPAPTCLWYTHGPH